MAINNGKVLAGGFGAGVVMNAIDYASNTFLLQSQWKAQLDALNPAIAAAGNTTGAMVGFILVDFVLALVLVWAYAAVRPRFGPGSGTATKVALLFWLYGGAMWASLCALGMFTWGFFALSACVSLVTLLVTANVGAMLYKEE